MPSNYITDLVLTIELQNQKSLTTQLLKLHICPSNSFCEWFCWLGRHTLQWAHLSATLLSPPPPHLSLLASLLHWQPERRGAAGAGAKLRRACDDQRARRGRRPPSGHQNRCVQSCWRPKSNTCVGRLHTWGPWRHWWVLYPLRLSLSSLATQGLLRPWLGPALLCLCRWHLFPSAEERGKKRGGRRDNEGGLASGPTATWHPSHQNHQQKLPNDQIWTVFLKLGG